MVVAAGTGILVTILVILILAGIALYIWKRV
jgi:hypothetical protein